MVLSSRSSIDMSILACGGGERFAVNGILKESRLNYLRIKAILAISHIIFLNR